MVTRSLKPQIPNNFTGLGRHCILLQAIKISKYHISSRIRPNLDLVNVDRPEISDLRSVGAVMIKMLTITEISHAEPLMLPSNKVDALEDHIGCEGF